MHHLPNTIVISMQQDVLQDGVALWTGNDDAGFDSRLIWHTFPSVQYWMVLLCTMETLAKAQAVERGTGHVVSHDAFMTIRRNSTSASNRHGSSFE